MLRDVIMKKLLSIDTTKVPVVKDVIVPGLDVYPLFLDTQNGVWVLRVIFAPGVTLPKHFHTGTVHFFTMSGSWHYLEHPDDPQTAGCYLYEPGGKLLSTSSSACYELKKTR